MYLTELSDADFLNVIRSHLGFESDNDSTWAHLLSDPVIMRTREALVDLELDIDAQLQVRRDEDPDWAKRALWVRSLVRRRIARVTSRIKSYNVTGKAEAAQWQGIAVRLAQAIARHEAALAGDISVIEQEDVELWATLDNENHPAKGSIRMYLMNLVVPVKYQEPPDAVETAGGVTDRKGSI